MSDTISLLERSLPKNSATDAAIQRIGADIKVALPAIVQSFDAAKQTVTVKCALLETLRLSGVQRNVDVGLIADVPIYMPRAGGFSLTLPVQQGDECLLVFADGCIDAWWQSGGQQARIDGRRHALSDAFALFGPWSRPRALTAYSTSAAQLRSDDGQTVIEVGNGEIKINVASGNVSVTGQQVTVTGTEKVTINGNSMTTIEGRVFLEHEHTLSSGTTGPVV